MEIVQERLEREFNLDLITTAPGVRYVVTTTDGKVTEIDSPAKMPDPGRIVKIEEPAIRATILTPEEHLGGIPGACWKKSAACRKGFEYITVEPRDADLRIAAQRDRARLLRSLEINFARLRLARLPPGRLLGKRSRQTRRAGCRTNRSMRCRWFCIASTAAGEGPRPGDKDEGVDSAPTL